MSRFLSLKFDYFTNFPIKSNWLTPTKYKIKTLSTRNKKRTCKNIILFILFLKFLKNQFLKKTSFKIILNLFIHPQQQNIFNYLRAPYKNKLSRNQIYNPRFKLSFSLKFYKLTYDLYQTPHANIHCINFLKKNLLGFESNILYLNKISIYYKSNLDAYWNYDRYVNYNA